MSEDYVSFETENISLKQTVDHFRFELATQKSIMKHFEGIAHIMMAEMKKARWVEAKDKSSRLSALFVQFNNEMKGFLSDKQQLLSRFCRIEHIAHSVNALLKQL